MTNIRGPQGVTGARGATGAMGPVGPAGFQPVDYESGRHLDTYTVTGVYLNSRSTDATAELGWPVRLASLLLVFAHGKFVFQICIDYMYTVLYIRVKYGDTWSQWRSIQSQ